MVVAIKSQLAPHMHVEDWESNVETVSVHSVAEHPVSTSISSVVRPVGDQGLTPAGSHDHLIVADLEPVSAIGSSTRAVSDQILNPAGACDPAITADPKPISAITASNSVSADRETIHKVLGVADTQVSRQPIHPEPIPHRTRETQQPMPVSSLVQQSRENRQPARPDLPTLHQSADQRPKKSPDPTTEPRRSPKRKSLLARILEVGAEVGIKACGIAACPPLAFVFPAAEAVGSHGGERQESRLGKLVLEGISYAAGSEFGTIAGLGMSGLNAVMSDPESGTNRDASSHFRERAADIDKSSSSDWPKRLVTPRPNGDLQGPVVTTQLAAIRTFEESPRIIQVDQPTVVKPSEDLLNHAKVKRTIPVEPVKIKQNHFG